MRISMQHQMTLVNYIKNHAGFQTERQIQDGVQFTVSGVVIDFHYSAKKPETFSLLVKNPMANPEFAAVFSTFAGGVAEPA
ncbi:MULTISPECIES: hypothetical protein [unclassified Pseudomonas]|uniref:hypothetical protein n=1 Tax=unclassified Pseudomonas TaxID=196821 RepID=UPI000A1DEE49|nr:MULTISPECIES: hypothetical protein [unclassified Pseudomonas]